LTAYLTLSSWTWHYHLPRGGAGRDIPGHTHDSNHQTGLQVGCACDQYQLIISVCNVSLHSAYRHFGIGIGNRPSLFPLQDSLSATNHIVRIQLANSSRATGEPSAVAATQTAQTSNSSSSLKAVELLPAAVTHHHPPHTARRSSVHQPSHPRHHHHLHSQQVWLKTSLPTSQTRLPLGSLRCSSAKRMLASSLVVTS
jgi:hypothetical protein